MNTLLATLTLTFYTISPAHVDGQMWRELTPEQQHIYTMGFANGMYTSSGILLTQLLRSEFLPPEDIEAISIFMDVYQQLEVGEMKVVFDAAQRDQWLSSQYAQAALRAVDDFNRRMK